MGTPAAGIHAFLSRYCGSRKLLDDDDIFALGFISSVVAVQLVLFLEKEFGVKVENEDLDLDNFRSIAAMSRLIARKRSSA
jgi:methoxymalonate biosynthesis acyl carrier protein